ncbi:hypothetical protein OROMI_002449 [Orobanche minor]
MNPMNPMGLAPFNSDPPPLPALPPPTTSFWTAANVNSRLKELYDTLNLAKLLQKELEMLSQMKERERTTKDEAENVAREHEQFDKINKEADEWRAREIAKDAAQQKSYSNENGKCQQPLERVGVTSNVEKFKSHIKNTEHFQSQAEDRVEKVKEIAKLKAKEEKRRLGSEN